MNKKFLTIGLLFFLIKASAQTELNADTTMDTYELINSKLAPGYNVVETPDCSHSGFGPHITQQWDKELGKAVFAFHLHLENDDDRCKSKDRQRVEIKTYKQSPDSLIAVEGETVEYRWKFKLDSHFQPSRKFTHIHQLKAVGGPDGNMPLLTISLRSGKDEKLQIQHAKAQNQEEIASADLSLFKGKWIQVKEVVTYGNANKAFYRIVLTEIHTGDVLLSYQSDYLQMWKQDAEFLRPKWGIYRSLKDSMALRDETVLFADFYLKKIQ